MTLQPRSVLVIEDNPDIARRLTANLSDVGYAVTAEQGGVHGLAVARTSHPDLIILDLTLPGIDGLEVCRRLRAVGETVPIIMLTPQSSIEERVRCIDIGADDYLAKPFSMAELMARVKAVFRRLDWRSSRAGTDAGRTVAGPLTIDGERRQATRSGELLALTAREFDLLRLLAGRPGRVYTRAQLLDAVWGGDCASQEHAVNTHINRLRAKIEPDPANPRYVLTVWGIGYKFSDALPA